MDEKYLTQAEAIQVEQTQLSTHEKFLTRIAISSLRLLQQIAADGGKSIDELTATEIINWFERDALTKQTQGEERGKLQW
jgi:hypothetical protein